MSEELNNGQGMELPEDEPIHDKLPVSGMYENWFLDYASYVILERAVPAVNDGLKPVQRRILHAMNEIDDGRFNKVANIIGSTMQFHPHGDASIGDAIVSLGQKDLLIETQGNWGDIRTGDSAAAPRYIEARLSKFAKEVLFNPQTTEWQLSYDGRKREPVTLPAKFPLLLAQGVEGIAVGLSTKILPHNFKELIKGSIDILKGKKTKLLPDFPTGGMADFAEYNEGKRGGKIKVRARIEQLDKKSLIIKDIPYSTTTTGLIDSIIKANDKGKIKIKQVVDNTAKDVEILITLAPGQSPDITIDALYAFTDCEVSISPNACVIIDEKPRFLTVNEILKINTDNTVALLTRELEILKHELLEKILFSSLEKIFIENRIYRDIEECETWEAVIDTIDKGLDPFKPQFYREITQDDIVRLTEIKIKRISRFDSFKADEALKNLEERLKETEYNLAHIIDYSIDYYKNLDKKYGEGRERKTEIKSFESISANVVAANNVKLYANYKDGFVGYGLKKDEFVCDCSDLDDVIAIRRDGKFMVSRISDKSFMGKDILYATIWKKGDERMVYNMVYLDAGSGRSMIKRFNVMAITRDKEYDLTKGAKGSKVHYLSSNPNGEAEIITVKLTSGSTARKKVFDFNFSDLEIKGKGAGGNILTRYPVRRVEFKSEGSSTLSGLDIYYDEAIGRLNKDKRGTHLGKFNDNDTIIAVYKDGSYEMTNFDLTNRYEADKIVHIEKYDPQSVFSVVHYDGKTKTYYAKRFKIETNSLNKRFVFISEEPGSKLETFSSADDVIVEYVYTKPKSRERKTTEVQLDEFIDVKGWKAIGNKLSSDNIKKVTLKILEESAKEEKPDSEEKELSLETKPKKEDSSPAKKKSEKPAEDSSKKEDDQSFGVGSTIELDF